MKQIEEKCNIMTKTTGETYVQKQIPNALWELMKEKDFSEITVTEIADRAGVSRVSFYRNYSSREDVLVKDLDTITDRFLQQTGISYKNDPLPVYFEKLFRHMKEHELIIRMLYDAGLINLIKDQFDRVFIKNYEGIYDPYKAYFYSGGLFNIFLLWLKEGCKETPEKLSQKLKSMMEK